MKSTLSITLLIFLSLFSYGQEATLDDFAFYEFENTETRDTYEVTAVNFRNQESYLTTSLDELPDIKSNILIFPNPAKSYIHIDGNFPVNIKYSIFTIDGKIVMNGFLESQAIDIQKLDTGVYLLQIDGEKSIKFIKNL